MLAEIPFINQRGKTVAKYAFLSWFGGSFYITCEVFYRGRSHWSMFVLAAFIFVVCDLMNEVWSWDTSMVTQVFIGTCLATLMEFIFGCIFNIWLGLCIWDYSSLPGNILGQICPQFTCLWVIAITVAIVLGDVIRWRFYGEERPRYRIGKKIFYI